MCLETVWGFSFPSVRILGRHKTCPYSGLVSVGEILVIALLSVSFPKSTLECRDMNLDLQAISLVSIDLIRSRSLDKTPDSNPCLHR